VVVGDCEGKQVSEQPTQQDLLTLLRARGPLTEAEVAEALSVTRHAAGQELQRAYVLGKVRKRARGRAWEWFLVEGVSK
jgi:predicted ArsR family transcriptional regulator